MSEYWNSLGDEKRAIKRAIASRGYVRFGSRAAASDYLFDPANPTPAEGTVVQIGSLTFEFWDGVEAIPDLPGLVPAPMAQPGHYGETDDAAFTAALLRPGLVFLPAKQYDVPGPKTNTFAAVLPDPSMSWAEATDTGLLDWGGPFGAATNTGPINPRRANIWRLADRVFVGGAASRFAGDSLSADGGTSWLSDKATSPSYLGINAQFLSIARGLNAAMTGAARTSDTINNGLQSQAVGAVLVNDRSGGQGWGFIAEIQHENGASTTLGLEIGAKNKGLLYNPEGPYTTGGGPKGIWLAGGGDATFGGAATFPANSAITILKNGLSGLPGGAWQRGLVIKATAIDGTDGSAASTTTVSAIALARRHALDWFAPVGTGPAARIHSTVTDAALGMAVELTDNNVLLGSIGGLTAARAQVSGTGTDFPTLYNGAGRARVQATGASADVDLSLEVKGAGLIRFGYASALATTPGAFSATRRIAIRDSAGSILYIPCTGAVW